jgi:hypothetical protein
LKPFEDAGRDVRVVREMEVATSRGGGLIMPTMPGAGAANAVRPVERPGLSPYVRQINSPWTTKIPASQDFFARDFEMVMGAGIGTTVVSAALSFQLPQDHVGWLQQFALYVRGSLATTRLQWTVRINQGPVSGWDNKSNPPGAANIVLITDNGLQKRIPNGATVDVLITNLDGAAITGIGGFLAGWYHPKQDELRYWGELD